MALECKDREKLRMIVTSGWCILGYGAVGEALFFPTHGYVDEGEDVVFDHDGEAEEDGVQHQHINTQLKVQLPAVQVDPKNLRVKKMKKTRTYGRGSISAT